MILFDLFPDHGAEVRLNSHSSWAVEQRKLEDIQPLLDHPKERSSIFNYKLSARKNALYRFATLVR